MIVAPLKHCPACNGEGEKNGIPCESCNATGRVIDVAQIQRKRPLSFYIEWFVIIALLGVFWYELYKVIHGG